MFARHPRDAQWVRCCHAFCVTPSDQAYAIAVLSFRMELLYRAQVFKSKRRWSFIIYVHVSAQSMHARTSAATIPTVLARGTTRLHFSVLSLDQHPCRAWQHQRSLELSWVLSLESCFLLASVSSFTDVSRCVLLKKDRDVWNLIFSRHAAPTPSFVLESGLTRMFFSRCDSKP